MKRKIILAVAPVSLSAPEGSKSPVSPDAVAEDVVRCALSGASIVHLHVRDEAGEQTGDLHCFDKTLRAIRSCSDIVIQGSTGGLTTLSLAERCVSVTHPLTQSASLNIGSVNFGEGVYVNTLPDIRYWCEQMLMHHVAAEMEVFDLSMVRVGQMLLKKGLAAHAQFNICLGFEWALPATWRTLSSMALEIGSVEGASFGVIHHGMEDMTLLAAAVGMGANMIRVGYEDSAWLEHGVIAPSNETLVKRAASLIRAMGCEVAAPTDARKMLYIPKES
jgi:3-keto-5-aminohexanoate cleavage enzyme